MRDTGIEVDFRCALIRKAGGPVAVDAATLMCALLHAGLDHRRYAFGGADWGKVFELGADDQLRECVE